MKEILVPVGSAAEAPRAAARAILHFAACPCEVHLVTVQRPLPRHVARFFSQGDLRAWHDESGMAVLAPAIRALDAAGIVHHDHVIVGHAAEAIVGFAACHDCAEIVLESPASGVRSLLHAGSLESQVRHLIRAGVVSAGQPPH